MSFNKNFLTKNPISPLKSNGGPGSKESIKNQLKQSNSRIDSLNQVVSTYEKALANRAKMEKTLLHHFGNFKIEGVDSKQIKEEAETFLKTDSDPENRTMFTFVDKDKKEIGARGGDFGNSGKYWFKTKYFENPVKPSSAFTELEKEKSIKNKLKVEQQSLVKKLPKAWKQRALDKIKELGYKEGSFKFKEYMKRAEQLAQSAGNI